MDLSDWPRFFKMICGLLVCFCLFQTSLRGQAIKIDEFGDIGTDNTVAHLDLFARKLKEQPGTTGTIVIYYQRSLPFGSVLRRTHGFVRYLVKSLGILEDRLSLGIGGPRDELLVELWVGPHGYKSPASSAVDPFAVSTITAFDSLYFGPKCGSEFTLDLEEPSDSIRFYASALRLNASMKGLVIVNPHAQDKHESGRIFELSRQLLVKTHGITADRFVTSIGKPRWCGILQLWIVPPDFVVPKGQTPNRFLQSQLMAEANDRYSVRRVEFVGNRYTRDRVLRETMPGLQEGEIFRKSVLQKSLADVSRLAAIYPISLDDVEVQLDRDAKTIDLTLFFRERPRFRR